MSSIRRLVQLFHEHETRIFFTNPGAIVSHMFTEGGESLLAPHRKGKPFIQTDGVAILRVHTKSNLPVTHVVATPVAAAQTLGNGYPAS